MGDSLQSHNTVSFVGVCEGGGGVGVVLQLWADSEHQEAEWAVSEANIACECVPMRPVALKEEKGWVF